MPLIKSKSKQAFKKNVETEMKENPGKRAQNLAIAYSVKRQAAKKKKMMADGGSVDAPKPQPTPTPSSTPDPNSDTGKAFSSIRGAFKAKGGLIKHPRSKIKMYAEGGQIDTRDSEHDDSELNWDADDRNEPHSPKDIDMEDMSHDDSELSWNASDRGESHTADEPEETMADVIMRNRRTKMMAKGGAVDHTDEVDLEENEYPELNHYDEQNEKAAMHDDPYLDDLVEAQPEDSNEHGRSLDSDDYDMIDHIMSKYSKRKPMR